MIKVNKVEYVEMTDEEYFSPKYAEYISNSRLGLINPEQGGSIEKYKEGLGNTFSSSLSLGSAVHELTLQPESFKLAESVNRPTAKMGAMADVLYPIWLKDLLDDDMYIKASDKVNYYKGKMNDSKIIKVYNDCIDYWKARKEYESDPLDKEPIYLDPKSREKLTKCIASVESNVEIQNLLRPTGLFETPISMNEAALLMEVECNGVPCKLKAKLDNFTLDLEENILTLNDLKTTGHYLDEFEGSWERFHYFRQMGMYLWMLQYYVKQEYKIEKFSSIQANMLLVSTIPNYDAGVYVVKKSQIIRGMKEFAKLLDMACTIK